MGRKVIDRVGKRFGKLEVLKFIETKGNDSYWLCRCDCGTLITKSASKLRYTMSCGCARSDNQREAWRRRKEKEAKDRRLEMERLAAERRKKEYIERQMRRNQEAGLRFDDYWMFGPGGQEWFESMVI